MNILLSGGAGYIGSHTSIALALSGHNVTIFDNLSNSSLTTINALKEILGKDISFVQGDILDTSLIKSTLNNYSIDGVIHLAGLKSVGDSIIKPMSYYETNLLGSLSLLKAINEVGIKYMVFSSSANVYGDPKYLPIDEIHPVAPTNPYGRTKLQVEHILEDLCKADRHLKVVNLRYFNPVGAHESGLVGENPKGVANNLMPFITRVATNELSALEVFGGDYDTLDGTGVRDFIHVMDLAEGHVAALNYLPKMLGFETFNLGNGIGYTVLQMIQSFEKVSGVKIAYKIVNKRTGDISSSYASPTKANLLLGWKAYRTIDDMCSSAWNFSKNLKKHQK